MKRLFSWLLAICMMIGYMPVVQADDWQYEAETTLFGSSARKINNIQLAAEQLDGTEVRFGETFSFNEAVGPREREWGYRSAKNGRGAYVTGGGVSQLATTLYLAAKDCPFLSIAPFETYDEKFVDWYVEDGTDAVITDYDEDKDFCFTSWYDGVVYISAWMDENKVCCRLEFLKSEYEQDESLIAEASTPLYGSENKLHNIWLASTEIDGTVLEWGDWFSFNEIVGPRNKENGYLNALNGRGVKVIGGGVAQVASTVYLAVKDLENVEVDPIRTYGERFADDYVEDPADAVVTDYNAGYDLAFRYWGEGILEIYLFEDDGLLICEIFEDCNDYAE